MIEWLEQLLAAQPVLHVLTLVTLLAPIAGSLVLMLLSITGVTPAERWVSVVSGVTMSAAAIASVLLAAFTMLRPGHEFDEVLWTMYSVGAHQLHASVLVDPLSAMMAGLAGCTIPVLARFSGRYLHRDPGYLRFFVLMGIGSVGWELLGLSSSLLVAFFWDRSQPLIASGRVFATYRVADIALLVSMVLLHHYAHSTSWTAVLGVGRGEQVVRMETVAATVLCFAFLLAAMGKSALFPLTGYVLRAMEGPTTSSALFYGTLSIHCGVYLILRVQPLLEISPVASAAVVVTGLLTALTAGTASRVRADAKGALALASAAQAGLMIASAGMGWTNLAMVHLLAHGILRLTQFLRAPSWLQDAQSRRSSLGGGAFRSGAYLEQGLPTPVRDFLYAAALSRFGIDAFIDRVVTRPLAALAHLVSGPRPRLRHPDGQRISTASLPRTGTNERGPIDDTRGALQTKSEEP
jgi:NADH:ubiquinone oxidoreductase subunit 5 (subunit L)/multisubunit Na+/H+ antiporter MnhA subunit